MATTLEQVRRTMVVGGSAPSRAIISALPAAASPGNYAADDYASKSSGLSAGAAVAKTRNSYAIGNDPFTKVNQEQKHRQRARTTTYALRWW